MSLDVPPFLSRWIANFLAERYIRVRYDECITEWAKIHAGVTQGTGVDVKFMDDSTAIEIITKEEDSSMQEIASSIVKWSESNHMKINSKKTQELRISFKRREVKWPEVLIGNDVILPASTVKLLGVKISKSLKWQDHVDDITKKASKRIYFLIMLKRASVPVEDIITVYTAMIRAVLEYGCPVWHTSLTEAQHNQIELIQRRVIRILCPDLSYENGLRLVGLDFLRSRRERLCKRFFLGLKNQDFLAKYVRPDCSLSLRHRYPLVVRPRTNRFAKSLVPYAISHQ